MPSRQKKQSCAETELREEKTQSEGEKLAVKFEDAGEEAKLDEDCKKWKWMAKHTVARNWRCGKKGITKELRKIEDCKNKDEDFKNFQKEMLQQELAQIEHIRNDMSPEHEKM